MFYCPQFGCFVSESRISWDTFQTVFHTSFYWRHLQIFLNRFVTIARAAKTGAVPQPCFLALHCDVFAKVVPAAPSSSRECPPHIQYTYIGFGYPSSQTELEQRGGGRGEGASQLAWTEGDVHLDMQDQEQFILYTLSLYRQSGAIHRIYGITSCFEDGIYHFELHTGAGNFVTLNWTE